VNSFWNLATYKVGRTLLDCQLILGRKGHLASENDFDTIPAFLIRIFVDFATFCSLIKNRAIPPLFALNCHCLHNPDLKRTR
jgi:hypothetical protein